MGSMQPIMKRHFLLFLLLVGNISSIRSQTIDCAYPMIFLHGWTGNETSWIDVYTDPDFTAIWGSLSDVYHAVANATTSSHIWGADGVPGTSDDDVLVQFVNESNTLAPGCLYAINLENFWNEDPNNPVLEQNSGDTPSFTESDSNEAAILKLGFILGDMIDKVLAANPDKSKVIVLGHSMGGLMTREYLQRRTPENPSGTPRWWVNPSLADGHQVAKFITTVTPHRGSNTLGNFVALDPPGEYPTRDGLPDLASEAVRDMRYSYACGFLGLSDCPGVYLFGGDEDDFISFPYPYWNDDVDCDGDENSPAVVGINISGTVQGTGDEWDGTYDNPNMPLPNNLRYTWITSDIFGDTGDGVVAWSRQWLYNGGTPYPTDGTPHRLTDTMFTNVFHTSANDDPNLIIRALDEADYPAHAWEVGTDALFGGICQQRATFAPEGPANKDPDWFEFEAPASLANDITIVFTPHPGLAGRIDFFGSNPAPYTPMSSNGTISQTWTAGTASFNLTLPFGTVTGGNTYYFRVIHDGVGYSSWTDPYTFDIQTLQSVPLDLLSFQAEADETGIALHWETARESNLVRYEIERSGDGRSFQKILQRDALNESGYSSYMMYDHQPLVGLNYYRLRIIEQDGRYSYSQVEVVRWEAPVQLKSLYPNPVGNAFRVECALSSDLPVELHISDALGRNLYQKVIAAPGALLITEIECSDWPAGWYVLKIRQGSTVIHQAFVK